MGGKRKKGQDSAIRLLESRVKRNVKKGKGVTNETVYRFCKLSTSDKFRGVFPCDLIPSGIAVRSRFIFIVNLAPKRVPNAPSQGHFVTICGDPSEIYYVDSYGLPCAEKRVQNFLSLCNRPIKFNVKAIQDLNSAFCALYAILFVLYFDKEPDFPLKFDKKRLRGNDSLCKNYIERIISS